MKGAEVDLAAADDLRRRVRIHHRRITASHLSRVEVEILLALRLRSGLSVRQLALTLSLSESRVREHLQRLKRASLVEQSMARSRRPGKPPHCYSLTPAGRELFPSSSGQLTFAVFDTLVRHAPETLVSCLRDRFAAWFRAETGAEQAPPSTTAEALAQVCSRLGYLPEVHVGEVSTQLTLHHCPFEDLRAVFPRLCEIELEALSHAAPGCNLQRTAHPAAGDAGCAYRLDEAGGNAVAGSTPAADAAD